MSEELEALDDWLWGMINSDEIDMSDLEYFKKLRMAILELKAIKEAKPREALEELFKTTYFGSKEEYDKINNCYNSIKQSLLKAQEQEKVLEIIKKKRIDLESFYITFIENDYDYNYYEEMYGTYGKYKLTKEEFELLKRYLCKNE